MAGMFSKIWPRLEWPNINIRWKFQVSTVVFGLRQKEKLENNETVP